MLICGSELLWELAAGRNYRSSLVKRIEERGRRESRCRLVGVLIRETTYKREQDNLKIKSEAPVAHVIKIVANSFRDGSIAA